MSTAVKQLLLLANFGAVSTTFTNRKSDSQRNAVFPRLYHRCIYRSKDDIHRSRRGCLLSGAPCRFSSASLSRRCKLGTITGIAPVGAIVGGSVGGALLLGGFVLLALFKTGRIKTPTHGKSQSGAAAVGAAPVHAGSTHLSGEDADGNGQT